MLEQMPMYVDGIGRSEYAKARKWHESLPKEAESAGFYLLDQTERFKRVFLHDHAGRPEETSVAAWDCARLVHYAGLAYGAGYLAEHEAWNYMLIAARMALSEYSSWEEYARGYVYGRWFWLGYWDDGMKETEKVVKALLEEPTGFRDFPWPSNLSTLEKLAAHIPATTTENVEVALEGVAFRMFVDCPACLHPILVREPSEEVRCDACDNVSKSAALAIWKHAVEDEEEDDSEEGEDDDDDDDDENGDDVYTNLADQIERFLKRPAASAPVCTACQKQLPLQPGVQRCACGRSTSVLAAPDWLRQINPRLRFIIGGPLAVGRPQDFFQVLLEKKVRS